mmetsp:Transcript_6036/g.13199  ORF Transcript_6036/g.13199 Transcript_6036/m.13199 type:complete len:151 (+) Transcript_6036:199-651(+)
MPSKGSDPNTNESLQIWRCPIILSTSDIRKFCSSRPSNNMALAVNIMYILKPNAPPTPSQQHEQTNSITSIVVKLYLPSIDPHVGINRILSHSPTPFFQQRHNMTLCVVSHDIMGIDHIHIGIHALHAHGGEEKNENNEAMIPYRGLQRG